MTKRKPHGMDFVPFVEQQIRDAERRGEFDDLPGKGKPIPGLDGPHDPLWWVKNLMAREGLDLTPATLALAKDVEALLVRLPRIRSERDLRRRVGELNARIARANATQTGGPPSRLVRLDADRVVRRWRAGRTANS